MVISSWRWINALLLNVWQHVYRGLIFGIIVAINIAGSGQLLRIDYYFLNSVLRPLNSLFVVCFIAYLFLVMCFYCLLIPRDVFCGIISPCNLLHGLSVPGFEWL